MYTIENINNLTDDKKTLITNYINKFIASRWRNEKESYTIEDCLNFLIIQHYIDMVVKLPISKQKDININAGCGGANNA